MPRKPRKRLKVKRQPTPAELAYLSDTDITLETGGLEYFQLFSLRHAMSGMDGTPGPRELWEEYREDFLPAFIAKNPGRRPIAWWHWDAPRQPDQGSGFWYEGTLPEPRRRIGGKGKLHENYVPFCQYGIPQHWDPKTLDPDDHLIFESQAAYLDRYGFLTESEKRHIKKHPELLEPEKVIFDEDEEEARKTAVLGSVQRKKDEDENLQ